MGAMTAAMYRMRTVYYVGGARKMRRATFLLGVSAFSMFCLHSLNYLFLSKVEDPSLQVFNFDEFYGVETSQQYVYHVSKECAPVVAFGGVGQVLGDLVNAQAGTLRDTSIIVILPKYAFLEPTSVIARISYTP